MAFRLFVDSADGVTLEVEYDYKDERTKIEDKHRTRDGSQTVYKWAAWDKLSFSVRFVNSSTRDSINTWWEDNTDLLFKDENSTQVYTVRLSNDKLPISSFIKPYTDLWQGKIELEGY